jgi:UDP-N-acetylmuramoyl-L-alanyl-D-glutamate--2,6-diaminopimelate ligase
MSTTKKRRAAPLRLTDLIPSYRGAPNPEIKGLTADSRQVKPGWLFAALEGAKTDGRGFIADAVRNGAVAILSKTSADVNVPVAVVDDPHRTLALAAAKFYGRQPEHVVAVTGTNGKTSTVHFVRQLWQAAGYKAASLGTLGIQGDGVNKDGGMTTPDAVALQAQLAELAQAGITHLAMEASSHGLDQKRLDGVKIAAAGFTNLTLDHLDYHGDMDRYGSAKKRLFSDVLDADGVAVLNADVPEFADFKAACGGRKVLDYGLKAAALRIQSLKPVADGQLMALTVGGLDYNIHLRLVGAFMAMNALCALGLAMAVANDDMEWVRRLSDLTGAPGRLQLVKGHPKGAVYVDYAHTPDALDNVLKALRPHTQGRLIVVAGCGGDRDTSKRLLMGRIAHDLADVAIITDDNPRSEDPAAIRAAMLEGAGPDAIEIGDRHEAITRAVAMVGDGDVLVIAGKGHEQGQTICGKTFPFNDVDEADKAISNWSAK